MVEDKVAVIVAVVARVVVVVVVVVVLRLQISPFSQATFTTSLRFQRLQLLLVTCDITTSSPILAHLQADEERRQ